MMRVVRRAVLAAALVALAVPVWAQTADEVVEKHIAALGGRAALGKLTSQVATGTISVSVQGNELGGAMEIYHKAPNKSRTYFKLDLTAMGAGEMVVDQRFDGKVAFESNSMQGDREITGSRLKALENSTFPTPLLDYKAAGAKVELTGKEKVDGRDAYVVLFTPKAGPASKQFFDAESYLLVRSVAKMDIPEMGGEVEQMTDISDYRLIDGVKVPFLLKIATAMQSITITVSKVEVNKTLDEAMFSKVAAK
jgi:outer membrane lipoprotein-sorting protein